jgi:hypothetical protein
MDFQIRLEPPCQSPFLTFAAALQPLGAPQQI